jgi:hypothetical protein
MTRGRRIGALCAFLGALALAGAGPAFGQRASEDRTGAGPERAAPAAPGTEACEAPVKVERYSLAKG